jgi:hypothetical protein
MPDRRLASEVKARLGGRLLAVPGVSGVGVPGGALTVYLEKDSPEARCACEEIVRADGSGAEVRFVVTGRLLPR